MFNNIPVEHSTIQKHLGVYDETLNFNTHSTEKVGKATKGILLSKNCLKDALLTIYKSFIRPHLDYGDIIYDRPDNK